MAEKRNPEPEDAAERLLRELERQRDHLEASIREAQALLARTQQALRESARQRTKRTPSKDSRPSKE